MSHINNTEIQHDYVMTRGDYFEMSFEIEGVDLSGHTVSSQYQLSTSANSERRPFEADLIGQVVTVSLSPQLSALINTQGVYFDVQFTPPSGKKFTLFRGKIPVIQDNTRP